MTDEELPDGPVLDIHMLEKLVVELFVAGDFEFYIRLVGVEDGQIDILRVGANLKLQEVVSKWQHFIKESEAQYGTKPKDV